MDKITYEEFEKEYIENYTIIFSEEVESEVRELGGSVSEEEIDSWIETAVDFSFLHDIYKSIEKLLNRAAHGANEEDKLLIFNGLCKLMCSIKNEDLMQYASDEVLNFMQNKEIE